MPYASVYRNMSEEQREKERARAREWHTKNYEKIKEKKKQQANSRYKEKGKDEYEKGVYQIEYKLGRLLAASKARAKKANLQHNLSLDYLIQLYKEHDGKCALSGVCFYLGKAINKKPNKDAPSIDRIIPELGYTIGNVRLVTHHVNMAMSEFGIDELISLVERIKGHAEQP